jgi:hypothetical protein
VNDRILSGDLSSLLPGPAAAEPVPWRQHVEIVGELAALIENLSSLLLDEGKRRKAATAEIRSLRQENADLKAMLKAKRSRR